MNASGTTTRSLLILAGLAMVLRIATAVPLHQRAFTSDEKEYLLLATRMIDDHMFLDSNAAWSIKTPGFPAVIVGMYAVFGRTLLPLFLLNAALGALVVVLGFVLMLELLGNARAAWFTAGALALHPSLVIYGSVLQSETLYIALLLLAVLLAVRLLRAPGFGLAALLGILLAVLTMTRAIGLAVAVAMLGALLSMMEIPWKRRVAVVGCALGFVILGLLPWSIRNFTVHHALVPVSTFSGISLLMGNNPYSNGTTALPAEYYSWVKQEAARRGVPAIDSSEEVVRDRVSREIAVDWMTSHPMPWARLLLRKMEVFWIYPVTTTADNHGIQAVAMGADVVLWVGGLAGIFALWRRKKEFFLLSSILIIVTAAHVMMHTEARYRLPLIALLGLFFGPGMAMLSDRSQWGSFQANRPALACAAVITLMLILGYVAAGLLVLHGEA